MSRHRNPLIPQRVRGGSPSWAADDPAGELLRTEFFGAESGPAELTLTADAAAFTQSGQVAALLRSRLVVADAGAYTVAGQVAAGGKGFRVAAAEATYTLAGQPAQVYTGAQGQSGAAGPLPSIGLLLARRYALAADAGLLALAGEAATLIGPAVEPDEPAVPATGGGSMPFGSVKKRPRVPVDFDWSVEDEDTGVLIAAGIF